MENSPPQEPEMHKGEPRTDTVYVVLFRPIGNGLSFELIVKGPDGLPMHFAGRSQRGAKEAAFAYLVDKGKIEEETGAQFIAVSAGSFKPQTLKVARKVVSG